MDDISFNSIENWRPIPEFSDKYEISDNGIIRFIKSKKIINHRKNPHGYIMVYLSYNGKVSNRQIHRMLAEAFIPNPNNYPIVHHKNKIRSDYRLENLEWVTTKVNASMPYSTCHPKLNDEQVKSIFTEYHTTGTKISQLAERYRVIPNTIANIVRCKKWKNITFNLLHLCKEKIDETPVKSPKNESWKYVEEYNKTYLISTKGNVISLINERVGNIITLKPSESEKGYLMVCLQQDSNKKWFPIHRLVAQHFIANPLNHPIVHHIDNNKKNNEISNLRWCDNSYNINQSFIDGRESFKGSEHPQSKLTEEQVLEIRHLYKNEDISYPKLAEKYSVSVDTIGKIVRRIYWTHI